MTPTTRFGAVAAFLTVLTAATAPMADAATGTRALDCTQTTVTRPALKRVATGTMDPTQGNLLSATVARATTGRVDVTTDHPVLDNTFMDGAYLRQHGWNTWLLGPQIGSPSITYYLMLPTTPPATGSAFAGLVFVDFGPQGGANDFAMNCTAG
ncbi:hypothetical protein ACA514_18145 [Actinomadura sp. NTSP31]